MLMFPPHTEELCHSTLSTSRQAQPSPVFKSFSQKLDDKQGRKNYDRYLDLNTTNIYFLMYIGQRNYKMSYYYKADFIIL